MSFWRRKEPQIPAAPRDDHDAARNELLGGSRSNDGYSRPPISRSMYSDDAADSSPSMLRKPPPQGAGGIAASRSANNLRDKYSRNTPVGDAYSRGRDVDADRAELFAGDRRPRPQEGGGRRRYEDDSGQQGEDEEEDVEAIKTKTKALKQDSVNSTRNALRIAREAEETARGTLMKLGDQSEKIANTERHLDVSRGHAHRAEDQTGELKQLNRSIFRPVIVFNKDGKRAAQEAKVQGRYEREKEERERSMADLKESQTRIGKAALFGSRNRDGPPEDEDGEGIRGSGGRPPATMAAKKEQWKRYQFEADEEDDAMEDELDNNLDELAEATKSLRALAVASGQEVDRQNQRLDRISGKVDKLDTHIIRNTDKLKKF